MSQEPETKPPKKTKMKNENVESGVLTSSDLLVLNYMEEQNRPFSATELVNNLQTKGLVKKSISAALAHFTSEGTFQKLNEKKEIYWYNQEKKTVASQEELDRLDAEAKACKEALLLAKEQNRGLSSMLAQARSTPTNEQLEESLSFFRKNVKQQEEQNSELRVKTKGINISEKKQVDADVSAWTKAAVIRKKGVCEIVNSITENMNMKPREFMESIGFELE